MPEELPLDSGKKLRIFKSLIKHMEVLMLKNNAILVCHVLSGDQFPAEKIYN